VRLVSGANPDSRFAAALVDGLVLLLPVSVLFYLYAAAGLPPSPSELPTPELFLTPEELEVLQAHRAAEWLALWRVGAATAAFALVWGMVYAVVAHCRHGRTVGKALLGLRLQRPDGSLPGAGAALARAALGVLQLAAWGGVLTHAALVTAAELFDTDLGFTWQLPLWVNATVAALLLALGAAVVAQARRRRSFVDALTGTVVVREGYGRG